MEAETQQENCWNVKLDTLETTLTTIEDDISTIKSYQFSARGSQANLLSAIVCVATGTTSSIIDWFGGDTPTKPPPPQHHITYKILPNVNGKSMPLKG